MALWSEHPDRDQKWADEERSKIGEERFRREHLCLYSDALLTLKDKNGKIFKMSIGDLYEYLGKNDFNDKYEL
jgi:hypothetical protein